MKKIRMYSLQLLLSLTAVFPYQSLAIAEGGASEADCDVPYYGIGVVQNYAEAFKCAESAQLYDSLILMTLNSEGTVYSEERVAAAFAAWEKADAWGAKNSMQSTALRKSWEKRKSLKNGEKWTRIDYCSDIAGDTPSVNYCAGLSKKIKNIAFDEELRKARASLPESVQAEFDKLVSQFYLFQKAEGERTYQQYIDGTIRTVASMSQTSLLQKNFQKEVVSVIVKRSLPAKNAEAYLKADKELNLVFKKDIAAYEKPLLADLKINDLKEYWGTYRERMKEYRLLTKKTQLAWIKYRDTWTAVVQKMGLDDTSIKTLITNDRVAELKNRPVGGNH